MKKIMFLGGGGRMLYPLLEAAKNEGYYVILCGNILHENAVNLVDKHYNVDCTDKEIILDIARKERIDGILGNAEYAMQYVSYIAENLGLIGNSCESVSILNEKYKFRNLQKRLNLFYPKSIISDSFMDSKEKVKSLNFPVFFKCNKASSSKGTIKVESFDDYLLCEQNFNICKNFSTDGKVCIEEFVECPDLSNIIDGEIFVHNGKILWHGLFTSKRNELAPFVPMTRVFPICLNSEDLLIVKDTVSKLIKGAGITFGELNIEMYFNKNHELFCIEINARQGGNFDPMSVMYHSGIDMYKLLVTTCMGDNSYYNSLDNVELECNYIVNHQVFSYKNGVYEGLYIDDKIKSFVFDVIEVKNSGDNVQACKNATDFIGYVYLKFSTRDQQLDFIRNINDLIYPVVH